MLDDLRSELQKIADKKRAKNLARFFKTGKGEYGEGDVFLGIKVPESRKIATKYKDLPFEQISNLLKSKYHEERLIALLILVHNFKKGTDQEKKKIFDFYLSNTKYVNNWDLVDLSAGYIVGGYLLDRGPAAPHPHSTSSEASLPAGAQRGSPSRVTPQILLKLARSGNLWERRIAMISTFAFIYKGVSGPTLTIAQILIEDKNDLIQKATGWMLREVGKRIDQKTEEEFLIRNYQKMGRTCLRYAIERFPQNRRKEYLLGLI